MQTMNALAASSTWTRIGALVAAVYGIAAAVGFTGDATPEMAQDVVDAGQAAAVCAADSVGRLTETVMAFGAAVGLWQVADTARATGVKDLTLGPVVVSKAG